MVRNGYAIIVRMSLVEELLEFKHTWGWMAKKATLGDAPSILEIKEFTTI
jgi:hypothetical protein